MPEVLTRVDEGDTYCKAFGHRWMLTKSYGQSYMECEICKCVRNIQASDFPSPEAWNDTVKEWEKS